MCADGGQPEERSLELLTGLVDKSMVVPDTDRRVTRYRSLTGPRLAALRQRLGDDRSLRAVERGGGLPPPTSSGGTWSLQQLPAR